MAKTVAHKAFTLDVTVTIQPDDVREQIETAFIETYGGIGTDEPPSEYLARKLEEHTLEVYRGWAANKAITTAATTAREQITAAATIRERRDKPADE